MPMPSDADAAEEAERCRTPDDAAERQRRRRPPPTLPRYADAEMSATPLMS